METSTLTGWEVCGSSDSSLEFLNFLCKMGLITSVGEDNATLLFAENFRNKLLMQELCETFKGAQLMR